MTIINTNVKSLIAQDSLRANNNSLAEAMERLSTGKRINSAKDDAAGLSISTNMTAQIRGLNMAIRNANDGISLMQTAEGAMQESTNILQRMRELAVQASNGTYSDQDRSQIQQEVSQLQTELDRIANTTQFNNQKILDGSFTDRQLQIGSNADQTMGVSLASINASVLGERADGPATAASKAKLDIQGMSTNAADYQGKSFAVNVNGVTSQVVLPVTSSQGAQAASVSAAIAGEDSGPATSMVIGNQAFNREELDLTTAAKRAFGIRVNDSEVVNVDFTNELMDVLGVGSVRELETASLSTADYVTQDQLTAAVNQALVNAGFTGDNAVSMSVDNGGMIRFDAAGDGFISLSAGVNGAGTAGTFVSSFVDATLAQTPSNAVDLSSWAKGGIKLTVNDGTAETIYFDDLLSDSNYVKDIRAVTSRELVNVLQTAFDNVYGTSGDNHLTVGVDQGYLTLKVEGGMQKVVIAEGVMSDGTTATLGAATLFGTGTIDNNDTTVNFRAKGIDAVTEPFGEADLALGVVVNGNAMVNIDMTSYLRAVASDTGAVTQDEMVSALQAAFDDHFTGEDAVTVVGYSSGKIGITVDGGAKYIKLTEYDPIDGGTDGTFVTTVMGASSYTSNGQLRPSDAAYAYQGTAVFADSRSSVQLFKDPFSLEQRVTDTGVGTSLIEAFSTQQRDSWSATLGGTWLAGDTYAISDGTNTVTYTVTADDVADATRFTLAQNIATAFNANSSITANGTAVASYSGGSAKIMINSLDDSKTFTTTITGGTGSGSLAALNTAGDLDVAAATNDVFTFELNGSGVTNSVTLTAGGYASLDNLASEFNRLFESNTAFQGDNAIRAVVMTGYDDYHNQRVDSVPKFEHQYLAFVNDAGQTIEVTGNGAASLLGIENNTVIDSTKILESLGGVTYAKQTAGLTDGGVDTTLAGGQFNVSINNGNSAVSRTVTLSNQSANVSFNDFVADVQSSINAAFAGDGFSVSANFSNGQMTLSLNQAGATSIDISGAVISGAFGGSLNATGTDAGSDLQSMSDVVSAINEDLTSANAGAVASFDADTGTLSFTVTAGNAGASSSVSLSGDDLAALQITNTAATGSAGNATAAKISEINITTAAGASDAIASIDNALTYVSNERSKLGAMQNRLEHTVSNLTNIVTNTSASRSRIEDADYGVETAALAKSQILTQAATAMLAQANQSSQSVLSLLK